MTNDPWDDERLEAAYAARGEVHPTPGDLTASTMAAIRSGARPATVSRWPQILAAAAAVAVVFGGPGDRRAGVAGTEPGRRRPSPRRGPAVEAPAATAPGARRPPAEVAGLPVISVSDAIAVRDAGVDGRELAVRGWLTRGTGPNPCQGKPGPSSLVLPSANRSVWLSERPQTMRLPDGGVGGFDSRPRRAGLHRRPGARSTRPGCHRSRIAAVDAAGRRPHRPLRRPPADGMPDRRRRCLSRTVRRRSGLLGRRDGARAERPQRARRADDVGRPRGRHPRPGGRARVVDPLSADGHRRTAWRRSSPSSGHGTSTASPARPACGSSASSSTASRSPTWSSTARAGPTG